MDTERALSEIEKYQIKEFPDSKSFSALSCEVFENYENEFKCNLKIRLKKLKTGEIKIVKFSNVTYKDCILQSIREATGFYIIDTSYLGWGPDQRYEVGDWDGDPPIFWAEFIEII